jgi:ribosome biogenesis GTPase
MIARADPHRIVAHVTRCARARPDRSLSHMIDPQSGAPPALPLALMQLGYTGGFAAAFAQVAKGDDTPARVVAVHRNRLVVATVNGDQDATLDSAFRERDVLKRPATGDWVAVHAMSPEALGIQALVPRRTAFIRGAAGTRVSPQVVAANVDYVLIVTALPGDFNERRLERYLALAWESGAMPLVVLTKCDLVADASEFVTAARALAPGVDVISVSAASDDGMQHLQSLIPTGATIALLGSSGVGKSTLINRLAGEELMRTADVDADGRGRHTTTHRELRRLANGMLVIDTPGMRELQLWSADAGLERVFDDIVALSQSCRFADCAHANEPGCAVMEAVSRGQLDEERITSWHKLTREAARARLQGDAVAASAERAKLRAVMRAARLLVQSKRK